MLENNDLLIILQTMQNEIDRLLKTNAQIMIELTEVVLTLKTIGDHCDMYAKKMAA